MPKRGLATSLMLLFLILGVLAGCASLPVNHPLASSQALLHPEETHLGQHILTRLQERPGTSGFYLLPIGYDAFLARVRLINEAERTLDLQYCIFHPDLTGKFLLDRILAAAQRGVRVRLLLDDWDKSAKMDWGLVILEENPNIEVRVFNPFMGLRGYFSRRFQMVFGARRLKGRMHNKAFIVDNSVAIVGGRNIADEYFGAGAESNFGDLDIMAIGPITWEMSRSFDDYWNSKLAIPIKALVKRRPGGEDLTQNRQRLEADRESLKNSEYAVKLKETNLPKRVGARNIPFVWADAEVFYDDPLKAMKRDDPSHRALTGQKLKTIIEGAQQEVLIIASYLVPGKRGVQWFKELRDRGITIKILTNSMASNDVPVAAGGYARYRKALLKAGVELYELKPNRYQPRFWDQASIGGSSKGALHAKAIIVDRQTVVMGSFNLDPRSAKLDTENGVAVHSPELAAQAAGLFAQGISPRSAYRVELGKPSSESEEWHGLVWIAEENGRPVRYFNDPEMGFWRRFSERFLSIFTPESML